MVLSLSCSFEVFRAAVRARSDGICACLLGSQRRAAQTQLDAGVRKITKTFGGNRSRTAVVCVATGGGRE